MASPTTASSVARELNEGLTGHMFIVSESASGDVIVKCHKEIPHRTARIHNLIAFLEDRGFPVDTFTDTAVTLGPFRLHPLVP